MYQRLGHFLLCETEIKLNRQKTLEKLIRTGKRLQVEEYCTLRTVGIRVCQINYKYKTACQHAKRKKQTSK